MGLPSTGSISLNEIHIEAGGASGAKASISDPDILSIVGKSAGQTVSFSEFRGKSASIPDASTSGRRKANGVLVNVEAITIRGGSAASSEACVEFQMRKITNGFEVRVRHVPVSGVDSDGSVKRFYTNTGSGSDLTSSFRRVLVMTGTELDSYKVDWNVAAGGLDSDVDSRYTDSNLKASDNVFSTSSARYKTFRVYAYASINQAVTNTATVDMTFYGRKSGVPDKSFGTYRITLKALAESTNEIAF